MSCTGSTNYRQSSAPRGTGHERCSVDMLPRRSAPPELQKTTKLCYECKIPSSASLAIPPIHKKTEGSNHALGLMWADGEDSLNFFIELTIQKRIDYPWYATVMEECRYGQLSEESYKFPVGLLIEHTGSWRADGTVQCGAERCASFRRHGSAWLTVT